MGKSLDADDIAASVATYATTASLNDVPEAVQNRVPLVLMDTIGVCIRGSETPYIQQAADALTRLGRGSVETNGATAFATGQRHDVSMAALLNAAGGTTLELDEGNQESAHPGIHTVVPAVAAGQHLDVSGKQLLDAILVGYEIGARLGDVIRPMQSGLHPHGGWSPVSAAVAVGRLQSFDTATMADAIRNAVNPFIVGHWQAAYEGATVRDFYTGLGCQHGIIAATLADAGVTGVDGAVEECLLPYTAADISSEAITAPFETLGEQYYLTESYMKVHAACRYTHAPLEAIAAIQDRATINPEDIERIRVRTFELGATLDRTDPDNVLSAKFSTPFALATRVVTGDSGAEAFISDRVADAKTQALAERVEVTVDAEFEQRASDGIWGAAVSVELTDGTTHSETVPDARGGGENPFTREEIYQKFDALVETQLSPELSEELRTRLLDAASAKRVDDILAPVTQSD